MRTRRIVIVAAVVLMAFGGLALHAPAQQEPNQSPENEGTLVEIGPDNGPGGSLDNGAEPGARRDRRQQRRLNRPGFVEPRVAVSRYMIGLGGGPLPPEVRAQVDAPAGEGVLVRSVEPGGPADEAGVQQYDIVLRANGEPIGDLARLSEIVGEQGEMRGRITLELLRRGRPETVWVTPVERPIDAADPFPRRGGLPFGGQLGGQFGDQFGGEVFGGRGLFGEGGPFGDRLGPLFEQFGMLRGEQNFNFGGPEGGVSVRVTRENNGPARVTVRSGGETWEFSSDDQEAIAALPEGVRTLVEGVLSGQRPGGFDMQLDPGGLRLQIGELRRRAQQMQQQADDLTQQLEEAPPFQPGAPAEEEGPLELQLPAEGD